MEMVGRLGIASPRVRTPSARLRSHGRDRRRPRSRPAARGPGLADPRRRLLGDVDGRGPRRQPDLRVAPDLPPPDGRARRTAALVHRPVQCPDLRRRDAARPALGRVGGQVQPEGRHRPQRPRRGGRVRGCRARARALAGRARDAPHRVPARQHRDHAGRYPRRHAAAQARDDHRHLRSVRAGRVRHRTGARGGPHRRLRLGAPAGVRAVGPVFALSALLSVGTAALVTFGSTEVRPEVVPSGRIVDLAYASLRGVLTDRATRRIFTIFGISFVAIQMSRPYIPLLVEGINGLGPGLASAIALVSGTAALVGALVSPLGGVIGDRIGFRPVLIAALGGASAVLFTMPLVGSIGLLPLLGVGLGAATATVSSMIFGLLATEPPADRRSAALNLVYLPLYAAGIIGPAAGAVVASVSGVHGLFVAASSVFLFGAVMIYLRRSQPSAQPHLAAADHPPTPVEF